MIASLHNDKNEITIPGFYNDVIQISEVKEKRWLKHHLIFPTIKKN